MASNHGVVTSDRILNALHLDLARGHEITGEVIECGHDVAVIKKGDLVSRKIPAPRTMRRSAGT